MDRPAERNSPTMMRRIFTRQSTIGTPMDSNQFTGQMAQEFHRRMAAITDAVQAGIWQAGVHDLIGCTTDYGFGQKRGLQTLVLKTGHRSAYVRLHWDTVLSDTTADKALRDETVRSAINELT
jgi:hypothetical protein